MFPKGSPLDSGACRINESLEDKKYGEESCRGKGNSINKSPDREIECNFQGWKNFWYHWTTELERRVLRMKVGR